MCKKGLVLFLFPHRTYVLDICRNCLTEAILTNILAGLGGSVGCAVGLETRRSRVQPSLRSATFFRRD